VSTCTRVWTSPSGTAVCARCCALKHAPTMPARRTIPMVGTQRGSWYVAAPCRRDDHDRERHECRDAHATEIHSPEVILHLRDEADALQGTQDLTQVRSQILFRRRQRIRGLRRFIQRRPAVSCNIRKKGPDDPCAPAEHRRGQEGHDRGFETKRLGDGWRRLRHEDSVDQGSLRIGSGNLEDPSAPPGAARCSLADAGRPLNSAATPCSRAALDLAPGPPGRSQSWGRSRRRAS
jgi:hypothetical protein